MISRILVAISEASGHAKLALLREHAGDDLLRDVVRATYEPHWNYRVRLAASDVAPTGGWHHEDEAWIEFLAALYECRDGVVSGNAARVRLCAAIEDAAPDVQLWMLRVVDRHLNIGCSVKTYNKVWPGLVSTFECQLAEKYDPTRLEGVEDVAVEPKLDGTRCLAFVDETGTRLFTRGGKHITNFDATVGVDLEGLCASSCVFDGELMSSDFSAMMGQVFRKTDVDASAVVFKVFDWVPRDEWDARAPTRTCAQARAALEAMPFGGRRYVELVPRDVVHVDAVYEAHRRHVDAGLEGTMVKRLDAPYTWRRSYDVMKLKDLHTGDYVVVGLNEGTGRYSGRLGSFVVDVGGVRVKVERGHMTMEEALHIYEHPDEVVGATIEVGFQEVTRDGSLRFPKFMRFRRDRDST